MSIADDEYRRIQLVLIQFFTMFSKSFQIIPSGEDYQNITALLISSDFILQMVDDISNDLLILDSIQEIDLKVFATDTIFVIVYKISYLREENITNDISFQSFNEVTQGLHEADSKISIVPKS